MVGGITANTVEHVAPLPAQGAEALKDAKGKTLSGSARQLRETANRIVGSVFYGTMLKALRESELKGKYGHGGRGEEAFTGQLHQMFAEQMGASGNHPLADAMVKAYERQARAKGTA